MNLDFQKNLVVFSLQHFYQSPLTHSPVFNRLVRHRHVIYFQPPIFGVATEPSYLLQKNKKHITVVQPYLPEELSVFEQKDILNQLIQEVLQAEEVDSYSILTDTPKAMPFIRKLTPDVLVYDGREVNQLSNPELEQEISKRADFILTGQLLH